MTPGKLIGVGLIILLGLPALVAASERRRAPDAFTILLGMTGLAWSWMTGGRFAVFLSALSGILVLTILITSIAFTQRRWERYLLTGGEVKLMTAAAIWLRPLPAIATVTIALLTIFLFAAARRTATIRPSRPEIAPFVMVTLLSIFTIS